jgi:excisionase family DNA binding protein
MQINNKEFYTRKELTALFNCSLGTIHNWTRDGKLQAYGIGGRVYYKVDEVHNSLIKL